MSDASNASPLAPLDFISATKIPVDAMPANSADECFIEFGGIVYKAARNELYRVRVLDFQSALLPLMMIQREHAMQSWVTNVARDADGNPDLDANRPIMIYPKTAAAEEKGKPRILQHVCVFSVPAMEEIAAVPTGPAFVRDAVHTALGSKLTRTLNAVAKAEDGDVLDSDNFPLSVAQFIERETRGETGASTYSTIAPDMLKFLKAQFGRTSPFFALLDAKILRLCLSNRGYAMATPAGEQIESKGLFVKIIHGLITEANKRKLDPTIFHNWLETREAKTFELGEISDEAVAGFSFGAIDVPTGEGEGEQA